MTSIGAITQLNAVSAANETYVNSSNANNVGGLPQMGAITNPGTSNNIGSFLSTGGPTPSSGLLSALTPGSGLGAPNSFLQNLLNQANGTTSPASASTLSNVINNVQSTNPSLASNSSSQLVDRRIRIRAIVGQEDLTYGTGAVSQPVGANTSGQIANSGPNTQTTNNTTPTPSIMAILKTTNGVIFPYSPTITYNSGADYASLQPTHSNQEYFMFTRAPSIQIGISGTFTAQNQQEAQYTLAVMHFCRTMRYMNFGANDPNRGLPPRMLLLSGYGTLIFNDLPIILKDFSITYPNDVDYVQYMSPIGQNANAWVPVEWTLTVNVIVQNTPNRWRNVFTLDGPTGFRSGALLLQKGWA